MLKVRNVIAWLLNIIILLALYSLYSKLLNTPVQLNNIGSTFIVFNVFYLFFTYNSYRNLIKEPKFTIFKIFVCSLIGAILLSLIFFNHTIVVINILTLLTWFAINLILNKISTRLIYPKPNLLFLSKNHITLGPFQGIANCHAQHEIPNEDIIINYQAIIYDASINNDMLQPIYNNTHLTILSLNALQEQLQGKIDLTTINPQSNNKYYISKTNDMLKYIFDVSLIILLAPIWLPLMIIFSILSLCFHGWPIFFTQKRVGKHGKIFTIYKLRTMIQANNQSTETMINDARITKLGKLMRKCRLDEFPQFFNILKGEMSLIGPRPERPELADKYIAENPFFKWREKAKPGISGWAQIHQGYAVGTDEAKEKTCYDLFYIKYHSFWLDINIALKTIITMLTGFGAK